MRRLATGSLLAVLALSGCTGDGEPRERTASPGASSDASGDASPSASPEAPAQDLVRSLLADPAQLEPVATAMGTVLVQQARNPVAVDVLQVKASAASTLLQWRLRSTTAERVGTFGSSMSRAGLQDTRGLAVQDADAVLQPYTYEGPAGGAFRAAGDLFCACSTLPTNVGPDGVLLYAVLPPLAAGSLQVEVRLPGIAPMTAVPVTR